MIALLLFIVIVGVLLYKLREKLSLLSHFADKPVTTATEIGAGIAEGVAIKIRDWTSKKASG